MRAGDKVSGFEALQCHPRHNYHIIDKNGRALYCGCMPSIRHGNGHLWMKVHYRSNAYRLEQWYREYKFERNLERRKKHNDVYADDGKS